VCEKNRCARAKQKYNNQHHDRASGGKAARDRLRE
jgi:hypothetical protein